jgi:hypothetical protein
MKEKRMKALSGWREAHSPRRVKLMNLLFFVGTTFTPCAGGEFLSWGFTC